MKRLIALTTFCLSPYVALAEYSFQNLPVFHEVTGISSNGRVVIGRAATRPYCWSETSGFIDLGLLPKLQEGTPFGVSEDGTTIVGERRGTGDSYRAFRYTFGTGLVAIGGNGARARGVSGNGTTVVGFTTNSGIDTPFRWSDAEGLVNIGLGFSG